MPKRPVTERTYGRRQGNSNGALHRQQCALASMSAEREKKVRGFVKESRQSVD
jgi:hypothetical protein